MVETWYKDVVDLATRAHDNKLYLELEDLKRQVIAGSEPEETLLRFVLQLEQHEQQLCAQWRELAINGIKILSTSLRRRIDEGCDSAHGGPLEVIFSPKIRFLLSNWLNYVTIPSIDVSSSLREIPGVARNSVIWRWQRRLSIGFVCGERLRDDLALTFLNILASLCTLEPPNDQAVSIWMWARHECRSRLNPEVEPTTGIYSAIPCINPLLVLDNHDRSKPCRKLSSRQHEVHSGSSLAARSVGGSRRRGTQPVGERNISSHNASVEVSADGRSEYCMEAGAHDRACPAATLINDEHVNRSSKGLKMVDSVMGCRTVRDSIDCELVPGGVLGHAVLSDNDDIPNEYGEADSKRYSSALFDSMGLESKQIAPLMELMAGLSGNSDANKLVSSRSAITDYDIVINRGPEILEVNSGILDISTGGDPCIRRGSIDASEILTAFRKRVTSPQGGILTGSIILDWVSKLNIYGVLHYLSHSYTISAGIDYEAMEALYFDLILTVFSDFNILVTKKLISSMKLYNMQPIVQYKNLIKTTFRSPFGSNREFLSRFLLLEQAVQFYRKRDIGLNENEHVKASQILARSFNDEYLLIIIDYLIWGSLYTKMVGSENLSRADTIGGSYETKGTMLSASNGTSYSLFQNIDVEDEIDCFRSICSYLNIDSLNLCDIIRCLAEMDITGICDSDSEITIVEFVRMYNDLSTISAKTNLTQNSNAEILYGKLKEKQAGSYESYLKVMALTMNLIRKQYANVLTNTCRNIIDDVLSRAGRHVQSYGPSQLGLYLRYLAEPSRVKSQALAKSFDTQIKDSNRLLMGLRTYRSVMLNLMNTLISFGHSI